MIALGEVLGYVVAAIFVNVPSGSWRYMLGSSLIFSTVMFVGIMFMPESPRFLMHKGKTTEAWHVWKQIRGMNILSLTQRNCTNTMKVKILRLALNSSL
jgi:MFS family permease